MVNRGLEVERELNQMAHFDIGKGFLTPKYNLFRRLQVMFVMYSPV